MERRKCSASSSISSSSSPPIVAKNNPASWLHGPTFPRQRCSFTYLCECWLREGVSKRLGCDVFSTAGLHLHHGHGTGAEDTTPVSSVLDEAAFRTVAFSDQYDPQPLRLWFSDTNSSHCCWFFWVRQIWLLLSKITHFVVFNVIAYKQSWN